MKKIILATILLMLGYNYAWTKGEVRRIYEPAMSADDHRTMSDIKKSGVISEILRFMNNEFRLSDNLTIRIGAPRGPLFDNQYGEIDIPYSFVTTTRGLFIAAWPNKSEDQIFDATMDVLMHVLLHEMGHALLDLFGIPAIRNEENEVDDLAAILLVEMFEDGGKIVLNAAKAFDLQSTRDGAYAREHRGTEHGLSAERFTNMACLVYGSNPEKHTNLLQNTGLTQADAAMCSERFKIRRAYWFETLEPNMKNKRSVASGRNASSGRNSSSGEKPKKGFWGSVSSTLDRIFDRN